MRVRPRAISTLLVCGVALAFARLYAGESPLHTPEITLQTPERLHTCIAFAPDSLTLFESGNGRVVRQWSLANQTLRRSFIGHEKSISAIALSPDGKRLASGGLDNTVRIWAVGDGQELLKIRGDWRVVDILAFSPNGKHLAVGGLNNALDIYHVESGDLAQALPTRHGGDVTAPLAFSPDGERIAAGGEDGCVSLWDWKTKTQLWRTKSLGGAITAIAFRANGSEIALLSTEPKLWTLDSIRGESQASTVFQAESGRPAAFAPQGSPLAFSAQAFLWDLGANSAKVKPQSYAREASVLALSADGKRLAITQDGSITIFSLSRR